MFTVPGDSAEELIIAGQSFPACYGALRICPGIAVGALHVLYARDVYRGGRALHITNATTLYAAVVANEK